LKEKGIGVISFDVDQEVFVDVPLHQTESVETLEDINKTRRVTLPPILATPHVGI